MLSGGRQIYKVQSDARSNSTGGSEFRGSRLLNSEGREGREGPQGDQKRLHRGRDDGFGLGGGFSSPTFVEFPLCAMDCSKNLTCVNSFHQKGTTIILILQMKRNINTENQVQITCPKLHNDYEAELGFEPRHLASKSMLSTTMLC